MEAAERINSKELQGTAADNVLKVYIHDQERGKGSRRREAMLVATGAWENTTPHHAGLKIFGHPFISHTFCAKLVYSDTSMEVVSNCRPITV